MTIAFDQDRARRRVDGTAANDDLLALGAKQAEMRGSTSETAGSVPARCFPNDLTLDAGHPAKSDNSSP